MHFNNELEDDEAMLMSHYALKFSEKAKNTGSKVVVPEVKFGSYCAGDMKQEIINLKKILTSQTLELK